MVFGIGSDVVQISRINSLVKRWGNRFLQRVFTKREIEYCLQRKDPSPHLAVRFGAKEAFLKALGVGYREGIRWRDIEVLRQGSGRPEIHLHQQAKALCEHHSICGVHLSMSHDGNYGLAEVLLETEAGAPR
jgi:holo-[acyl-carrier protein] synthase